jgi:hypothetical protein
LSHACCADSNLLEHAAADLAIECMTGWKQGESPREFDDPGGAAHPACHSPGSDCRHPTWAGRKTLTGRIAPVRPSLVYCACSIPTGGARNAARGVEPPEDRFRRGGAQSTAESIPGPADQVRGCGAGRSRSWRARNRPIWSGGDRGRETYILGRRVIFEDVPGGTWNAVMRCERSGANQQLRSRGCMPCWTRWKARLTLVEAGYEADDDGLWRLSDQLKPSTALKFL